VEEKKSMQSPFAVRIASKLWTVSLASAAMTLGLCLPALAATLCVNPHLSGCQATIGAAVSLASPGDTIEVAPGTYAEEVVVAKPLTLQGTGDHGQSTIIDATGLAHAILVTGVTVGPVTVERFTAANANREGILVEDSRQVTVANNTVKNNDKSRTSIPTCPGAFPFDQDDCGEGLHLRGTADSVVSDNIVRDNAGGILITDETGPAHNNLIVGNLSEDNIPDCGITLPSHPPCSLGASANDVNGCGAPLIGPSHPSPGVFHNEVVDNVSKGNGAAGTGIFTPTPGTSAYGNLIADNLLKDNGEAGVSLHSHRFGQNLNDNVIVENIINGNGGDPDAEGASPPPVGIVVFSDASGSAAPITGTMISQNTITDEDVDVWVGSTATNARLFLNNLLGGSSVLGVKNTGTGTVDAMKNYWGCPGGPGTGSCSDISGTVLFAPFSSQPFSSEK
jgi:parallel beta-helix repeat protein